MSPIRKSIQRWNLVVALIGVPVAALLVEGPSAAAASRCGTAAGVPATLGTDSEFSGNGDAYADELVPGLGSGLALEYGPVEARPRYRRSVRVGLDLCQGDRLVARLPRLASGQRVVGLSVNGTFVAWRVTGPRNTGYLRVGRVSGKKLVGVRKTTSLALRRNHQRNARILVMPDGSAAWSLRENGRAGVWMWPAGRSPRKVASLSRQDALDTSTDVRIIDSRHVFLPQTFETARYGPTTPGRCPTTVGGSSFVGGPLHFLSFRLPSNIESTTTESVDAAVVCDTKVGDYIRTLVKGRSTGSQYGTSTDSVIRIFRTAGVFVTVTTETTDGALQRYRVDADPPTTDPAELVGGRIAPNEFDPAAEAASPPVAPYGPQMVAGAVTWSTLRKDAKDYTIAVDLWLADRAGTRRVGVLSGSPSEAPATDPGVRLDRTTLSWNDGTTVRTIPVNPTSDPIDVAAPPTS